MDFSVITYHFILPLLEFFKKCLGSYGWAIIAVTLFVKIILYPLTKHQTQSMQKMQALQPKIKLLQDRLNQQKERYKDKPAKLKEVQMEFQKDMMEFYKTNKVNPLGGCMPTLLQIPVLIALFMAFNGSPFKPVAITSPIEILEKDKTLEESIKGSSSPIIFVDKDGKKGRIVLNPGHARIPVKKEITYKVYKLQGDLNGATENIKWHLSDTSYYNPSHRGKDLSVFADLLEQEGNTTKVITKKPGRIYINAILPASNENDKFLFINGLGKTGAVDPLTNKPNIDVIVLVCLFVLTIWLSGKVTAKFSPAQLDPSQAQMQKMMQTTMPVMVGFMTLLFPVPAGVLLYFVASGFIQAIQSWLVMRKPISST